MKIGEVYWMEIKGDDSEQKGIRPAIIIQNNVGNQYSPNVIAIPTTTKIKHYPVNVILSGKETGMRTCMAICNNPVTVSKSKVYGYIATLSDEVMNKIAYANAIATGLMEYLTDEQIAEIREKNIKMNG